MNESAPVPPEVLAERAARAIAEFYQSMGPGPLPWAIAERFVAGALERAVAAERAAVAGYLRDYAALSTSYTIRLCAGELAGRIERGDHAAWAARTTTNPPPTL